MPTQIGPYQSLFRPGRSRALAVDLGNPHFHVALSNVIQHVPRGALQVLKVHSPLQPQTGTYYRPKLSGGHL